MCNTFYMFNCFFPSFKIRTFNFSHKNIVILKNGLVSSDYAINASVWHRGVQTKSPNAKLKKIVP